MNFTQLQQTVSQYLTKAEVKAKFGDLRKKETWEAAYASITTAAKEVAQEAIDTVAILADNSAGLGETLVIVGQAIVATVVAAMQNTLLFLFKAALFCWFFYIAWKGEDIPQVQGLPVVQAEESRAKAAIAALKATKAAFCQGYREGFTVPQWVAKSAKVSARINKRILEGVSLMATPHGLAFVQADIAG